MRTHTGSEGVGARKLACRRNHSYALVSAHTERERRGNGNRGICKRMPSTRVLSPAPVGIIGLNTLEYPKRRDKRPATTKPRLSVVIGPMSNDDFRFARGNLVAATSQWQSSSFSTYSRMNFLSYLVLIFFIQ